MQRSKRMRPLLTILLASGAACAAEGTRSAGGETFLDMLRLGLEFSPIITLIFALLTFISLFLVFHTVLSTREGLTVPEDLRRQMMDDLASGDVEAAQQRVEANTSLFAQVVLPGLKLHDHPIERIEQAMEGAGRRAIGSLRQEVTYLANIGVIAPMIGLLGTVLGLMRAFNVIGDQGVKSGSKAMLMSPAIGQAMTTTAVGLMVGIPAMGLYYLCMSRVSRVADEVEIASEETASALNEARKG